MRMFVSVELPDEVRNKLAELIGELKNTGAAVKWVGENNLHITLKFLGWVDDPKKDEVIELTGKAASGTGKFKIKFEGVGTFPCPPAGAAGGKSPRVIWVGVSKGGDRLVKMAKALEKNLSQAGYKSEKRDFASHITIGRVNDPMQSGQEKKGVDKLIEKIGSFRSSEFGEMLVNQINVMQSILTPKGPIYEKIKEVKI
ncbi:RNA 2',3'-cyclic phosphodiesterase [Candidatus Saganbacteria bacterium]|uniref:RNA 2',3'-cyclic phosphodiesterase n=1 Tax=Candidatus Saganbacteria bacterium TaxID=2575572 RepID=A0A9D6ULD3_UNCSA|nr:RNA 2',3'-cyclic phosphodiesterase [Candidatus Saganbacteria bacterium]